MKNPLRKRSMWVAALCFVASALGTASAAFADTEPPPPPVSCSEGTCNVTPTEQYLAELEAWAQQNTPDLGPLPTPPPWFPPLPSLPACDPHQVRDCAGEAAQEYVHQLGMWIDYQGLNPAGAVDNGILPAPTPVPYPKDDEADEFVPGGLEDDTPPELSAVNNALADSGGPFTVLANVRCARLWIPVQAQPSDMVIGNCRQDWTFQATKATGPVKQNGVDLYWWGGHLTYDYNYCGWMRVDYTSDWRNDYHAGLCEPNPSSNRQEYIFGDDRHGSFTFTGSAEDGVTKTVLRPCSASANFQPWHPSVPIQITAHLNVGDTVKIRYMAKYPSNDATGYYYMAHLNKPSGEGNWMFMPLTCLYPPWAPGA